MLFRIKIHPALAAALIMLFLYLMWMAFAAGMFPALFSLDKLAEVAAELMR